MLLLIHNLPNNIKYAELKSLIQTKCGVTDVILDNLTSEGATKKVTVGLADDGDAAILVRKINGLYVGGLQLYVEDMRQKRAMEQPYHTARNLIEEAKFEKQIYRGNSSQERNLGFHGNQGKQDFHGNHGNSYQDPKAAQPAPLMSTDPMTMMMNYAMGSMYYVPPVPAPQTNMLGFGNQPAPVLPPLMSQFPEASSGSDWAVDNMRHNQNQQSDDRDSRQRQNHGKGKGPRSRNRNDDRFQQPGGRSFRDERMAGPSGNARPRSPERTNWDTIGNLYDSYQEPEPMPFNPPQVHNQRRFNQDHHPPENVYGSHASEGPSGPAWEQQLNERGQRNEPSFQPRRDPDNRRDTSGMRGNGRPNAGPNREDWREEPRKRVRSRWANDEPQAKKRFVQEDTPRDPNWRAPKQNQPKAFPKGPKGSNYERDNAPPRGPNSYQKGNQPPKGPNSFQRDKAPPRGPNQRDNQPPQGPNSYQREPVNVTKQLNKEATYRAQAASSIGRDMLSKMNINSYESSVYNLFKELKLSIRARLNLLLGDTLSTCINNILVKYRQKFPASGDKKFYIAVLESVKKKTAEEAAEGTAAEGGTPGTTDLDAVLKKVEKKKPEKKPAVKPSGPIPKFPNDDKKAYNAVRRAEQKGEAVYSLPPEQQKVLDEEADILCDLFMGECTPENDEDKPVCEKIADEVADEFRNVMRTHIIKRILNITNNLPIRMFCETKALPPRDTLEKFFKTNGLISMKKHNPKSKRQPNMLIACCDSFESYDKMLAMNSVLIGGVKFDIRPLHLVPPKKISRTRVLNDRQRFIHSQIDKDHTNLLKPANEQGENTADDTEAVNNQNEADNDGTLVEDGDNKEGENENGGPEIAEFEFETANDEDAVPDDAENYDLTADDEEIAEHDVTGDDQDIPEGIDDVDEDDLEDY